MASNTDMFNEKSGAHAHKGHGKAMFWHGALMLGMVLGAVALAGPAGAATIGDLAVQSLYVIKDMAVGLVSNLDVVADMAGNAWEGSFAPNTWDAMSMHGSAAHGAATGGHAVGHAFSSAAFDQWLGGLSPEQISSIQSNLKEFYDGMPMRQYFEINHAHGMH